MIRQLIKKLFINIHFAFLVIIIVVGVFYFFVKEVELTPQITSSFFFSKHSKIYKDDASIYKKFTVGDSIVLTLPTKNPEDPAYLKFISQLSDEVAKIKRVQTVQSLTRGPPNLKAALNNPLWTRFLDSKTGKSSLIVCFIDLKKVGSVVPKIKQIVRRSPFNKRRVYISGIPYIIEEIRQMLTKDMKQFIAGAVLVSSCLLLIIFLSLVVTLGAIVTALAAAALTLVVQDVLGYPVGILTANLGAIVYVLTVSHIVFLTSNWRQSKEKDKSTRLADTLVTTFPASFWAAATTVFGFCSLIFVEAKPLQQLGVGGTIGSLSAFLMAYFFYPVFLRFSRVGKEKTGEANPWFFLPLPSILGVPLALCLVVSSGYLGWQQFNRVNTDPSLLTYFKETQEIHKGIQQVDKFGGSNPINFVISDLTGTKLTNDQSFQKMLALQKDLESHPAVGSVLSLPVLMQETQTNFMASLLPWGSVINILSRDQYGKVARGFITKNRKQGLFVVRMKETGRTVNRDRIVNQLMAKPRKHGLRLDVVGGSYYMQSELAQKIRSSMEQGVQALVVLFLFIIFFISISLPITLYAGLSIAGATACFIGCLGYFKVPVDIISSPSVNIILGLAVDGMIHIILAARRLSGPPSYKTDRSGWIAAMKSQGPAVLISSVVIAAGFSVFALSNFPPSQRFGLEIVFGTVVAMLMTLLVLPHLALLFRGDRLPKKEESENAEPELRTLKVTEL